ncbi:DUF3275 family protein [Pseudomonas aeruginosa]
MATPSASEKSVASIVVPGQLTLRTIRGKNGPFTVGRLATHLGTFEVKNPELEQYPEGKYDGEFIIRYIFPKSYRSAAAIRRDPPPASKRMTLRQQSTKLSRDEARSFATQDVDPLDEEQGAQPAGNTGQARQSVQPGPPSPRPRRRPQTRWSIPRPLAWMRRHLLRLLPLAAPKTVTPRSSACCGRWASP